MEAVCGVVQVIFMTGWAPSDTTPKAAKRGSATISFSEMAEELQKRGAVAGRAEPAVPVEEHADGAHSGNTTSSTSSSSSPHGNPSSSSREHQ